AGIPAISPRGAVCVRQPALSVARLSDCRQSPVARFRSVLRVARRLSNVVVFLSVGPLRMAEPLPQRDREFSPRPHSAPRPAVRPRRGNFDAPDPLSNLSADGEQSRCPRLLAALARIAVLAVRTDVVLVAVVGGRLWHCCSASI